MEKQSSNRTRSSSNQQRPQGEKFALSHPLNLDPNAVIRDPGGFAESASANSIQIANAVARLGMPGADNAKLATDIWTGTLSQIEMVQQLFQLGRLPFQDEPMPTPPE